MEEKFDKEKYQKEHPMDYIKAVEFITSTPQLSTYIFDIIYKVTRLHIPNTLFKYYSLNSNLSLNDSKLETLKNQQVYMAEVKDLNDPFDSKAYYYDNKEVAKIKRLKKCNGKIFEFTDYIKVASFTAEGINSMPMWAHYSNNHEGYCIEYEMKDNLQLSASMFPVQYVEKRIDITPIMLEQCKRLSQTIDQQIKAGQKVIKYGDLTLVYVPLLYTNLKMDKWKYENEYRCTIGKTLDSSSNYTIAKPKAIYIGARCLEKYKTKLIQIAKELSVPIYQMKYIESSEDFKLKAEIIK